MSNKKVYGKFAVSTMATAAAVVAVAPAVSAETDGFSDVKAGDSHYEAITSLVADGVIKGYPDDTFKPGNDLSRANAAVLFANALGLEELEGAEVENYFSDVSADHLYAGYIAAVAKEGVFKGSNGEFQIDQELTREAMASTLVNAFGLTDNGEDVDINLENVNETHKSSVQILANYGITNQLDDFRPGETVTRGQFATFLYKSLQTVAAQDVIAEVESEVEKYKAGIDVAEADGYVKIGPYVPGMGQHYANMNVDITDGVKPNVLLYAQVDGEWTLVGVEWASPDKDAESPVPGQELKWNEELGQAALHYWLIDNPNGQFADFNPNVDEVVTAPAVESVKAINAKQVEVKFNVELDEDSAEDVSNYEFGLQASPSTNVVDDTGASAVLKEDGKTVVLTLEDGEKIVNDTDKNVITVNKELKAANGDTLGEDYKANVSFVDTTVPTIVEIEQTGSKQLRVVFSEPVQDADGDLSFNDNEITIDGGAVPVQSITADTKNSTLIVNTFGDLTEGEHTLKLVSKSVKDFADFVALEDEIKFTAVDDTTVPTVTVKSADAGKVTIQFSKKVKIPANNNVVFRAVYNNNSNEVEASTDAANITNPDGSPYTNTLTDEVVIDFPQDLPPGDVKLYIEYKDNDDTTNVIKDGYGVTLPEQTLVANVVTDTEKPTVTKVEAEDKNTVDVTFSEEVDRTTAETEGNYTIKDADDDVVAVTNAVLQADKKTVRLTTANLDGGNYSIEIEEVKDVAVPTKNKMDTVTKTFQADDSKVPTSTAQYVEGDGVSTKDKLIIKYSEAMATTGAGSIAAKGNYQYTVDGTNYKSLSDKDTLEVSGDNKTVTITLADNVTFGTTKVKYGAVTDLAGNKLDGTVGSIDNATPAAVGIESAAFTAVDRLEVVFDSLLTNVDATEIDLVKDSTGTAHTAGINLTVYSHTVVDGKSKVVFALDKDVNADGTYETDDVALSVSGATDTETADGIVLGNLAYNGNFVDEDSTANVVEDKISPEVAKSGTDYNVVVKDSVGSNGIVDEIDVTFTESVKASTVSLEDFQVDGYEVEDLSVAGPTVTLEIKEANAPNITDTFTVKLVGDISDVNDNVLKAGSTEYESIEVTAPAAPTTAALATGSTDGTTKLTGVTNTMEYKVGSAGTWTTITTAPSVDNIAVNIGDKIYVREAATPTTLASASQELTIVAANIKPAAAPSPTVGAGSSGTGFTMLSGLTDGVTYEYFVDTTATAAGNAAGWSTATSVTLSGSTSIDDIAATNGTDYIHIRVKATATQPASLVKDIPAN